jgi:hypothetical protein
MGPVNKIFESLKVLVAPVFLVFALWAFESPIGESDVNLILQLTQALIVLIAGLIGGSGISRLWRAFKEDK